MRLTLAAVLAAAIPFRALGQEAPLTVNATIISDYRERGLSWSGGKPAAQAGVEAPLGNDFGLAARVGSARGAARHGGADAVVDLEVFHAGEAGLWQWHGAIVAHAFLDGEGAQDYIELDAGAGVMMGPLDLSLLVSYAPPQDSIGGSNRHGRVRTRLGLMGTPVTVAAQAGCSAGTVRNPVRAMRLRPGGSYCDWMAGAEYALGPMTFSLRYSDTDIRRRDVRNGQSAHHGAVLVAGARLAL